VVTSERFEPERRPGPVSPTTPGKPGKSGKIRVLFAGRARADFLSEGLRQFLPRLRRYRTEIVSNPKPGKPRDELAFFERTLKRSRRVIALDPGGEVLDTHGFAALLKANAKVDLLIGGSDGLDASLLQRADACISLSALTLSHELALLVLLEQIYRAETLASGHPYHRD
jgi:23S rRNA (pseudouridine1915-N3)-methyltransferase